MELTQVKEILIVNLGGIGDILLSTPALRTLKQRFSQSAISMLIFRHTFEAVKGLPYIENIFCLEEGCSPITAGKNLLMLWMLRKGRYDLAVNMRTMLSQKSAGKINLLLDCIKPRIKAGRDTEGRGVFFDIKIQETSRGEKYEMEYDIDMARALGANAEDRRIDFEVDSAAIDKANRLLNDHGVLPQDLVIGIHPGGKLSHRWPIENFSRAINEISKEINCKFVAAGTSDEAALGERLRQEAGGRLINFSGKLTLKELGALIKRCKAYLCNDTAAMHIAAILDVPMIAIFGGGYLKRFDPRNISDKAIVLHKDVDCSPCNKLNCNSMKCLKEISPDEVVAAVKQLLAK